MFFRIFALIISITSLIIAIPDISCPNTFESNGFYNDAGIMADFVSTQPTPYEINGVCGTYNYVHEVPGKYDTLLRVYKNLNENVVKTLSDKEKKEYIKELEKLISDTDFVMKQII